MITLLILHLFSCSSSKGTSMDMGGEADPSVAGAADTGAWANEGEGGSDGGMDADDGFDSEEETDAFGLAPASTPEHIFIANPNRNTVSRVTVPGLQVLTTDVGTMPDLVIATADGRRAVTLNLGSDDLSVIDAATLDVQSVAIRDDMNQMVLSPDGQWAACWHDPDAVDEEDPRSEGTQSYSEISLVNLGTLVHSPMVVGFHPRSVQFTQDSATAIVVSDAYLATVDLSADDLAPTRIPIADDLLDPPKAEEVVVSPDGSWALIRQFAATDLRLVHLDTGEVGILEVGLNPTDLDITPDGTKAIAVARTSGELWIYDFADPYAPPEVIEMPDDQVFGSLAMSPTGALGLLYSTATGESVYGTWDLDDPSADAITVRGLIKPLIDVGISPTGDTAVLFHDKTNGPDIDAGSPVHNSWAISTVDLDDFFASSLRLSAEPMAWANTDDGSAGFFILEGRPYLEVLHYDSLLFDEIRLGSKPLHVGVLPGSRTAWVNQDHELGRMGFYDLDSQDLETITGFELNAGIED